jgi:hypothetical protein
MNNYYGVFCIASQLNEERNLDVIWETANKLYDEFLTSEYNDHNESELECIYKFMNNSNKKL